MDLVLQSYDKIVYVVLDLTRSSVGLHHFYICDASRCNEFRFLDYFIRGDGRCPFYSVQHQITLSKISITPISPQLE